MNRQLLSLLITVGVLLLLLVAGCSAATPAPAPSTVTLVSPTPPPAPTLPVTQEVTCWTLATVVEPGQPPKLGGTNIKVAFSDYSYDGIVGGGGFVIPARGKIDQVNIGGKAVTLKTHDFGKGSIDTEEFGTMDVLFKANINSECAILVATPEQLAKVAAWIQ